jgi:hypothetical protein
MKKAQTAKRFIQELILALIFILGWSALIILYVVVFPISLILLSLKWLIRRIKGTLKTF